MNILQTYHWTVLFIFFTIFMIFYNTNSTPSIKNSETTLVKKIVAYSLNKQIELDGEEFYCDKQFAISDNISYYKDGLFWKKIENEEVYVTSLTLDERLYPYRYLRIVGVVKGNWNKTMYCQVLTSDGQVKITKTTITPIWYEKWNMHDNNTYYNPILMSCRLPNFENQDPLALSLSTNPCRLSNIYHKIMPSTLENLQRNFTICVKPLNFKKDMSNHLVQWIEISKIIGAQYFHIFLKNVTKNTRKVLEWYKHQYPHNFHIEDFTPLECQNCTRNFFKSTWQRRKYEVVTYNKCFNRNLNSKFVIPLDVDEIIVPKTVTNWNDLVQDLNDNYASLIVQNVYFFSRTRYDEPFFLNEKRRAKVTSAKGENSKSFISTKNTLTVFNHYGLHLIRPGVIKDYFLPFQDVQLNHYKVSCDYVILPECVKYQFSSTLVDNVISKYKNQFNERYVTVLQRLNNVGIKIL
ncbi:unnamed protein product [Ceutorhynchus assimilis]|uniref:Glycosyltransferase family 92 protein n=1 Tax=Ceutorhynchus assimilis TaxID=467358 RepID=A0A9N9MPH0_9CUCU|nr:unnamed protein product [Ceutorhynchus assimilis]